MFAWLRRLRKEEKTYQFLHVPKTAGTSLSQLLTSRFRPEEICPAQLWTNLLALPRTQLKQYRLFNGHLYYHLRAYLGRPVECFTYLRDPVERSLSHYEHILRHKEHYLHDRAREQGSLLAFLNDPVTLPMIWNFQTRSLAQALDPVAIDATLGAARGRPGALEQALESVMPADHEVQALLQTGCDRLEELAFVGVVERLDESVRQMFRAFGWGEAPEIPRVNVSSNKVDRVSLSDQERRALDRCLELDHEIYARAMRSIRAGERHAAA